MERQRNKWRRTQKSPPTHTDPRQSYSQYKNVDRLQMCNDQAASHQGKANLGKVRSEYRYHRTKAAGETEKWRHDDTSGVIYNIRPSLGSWLEKGGLPLSKERSTHYCKNTSLGWVFLTRSSKEIATLPMALIWSTAVRTTYTDWYLHCHIVTYSTLWCHDVWTQNSKWWKTIINIILYLHWTCTNSTFWSETNELISRHM